MPTFQFHRASSFRGPRACCAKAASSESDSPSCLIEFPINGNRRSIASGSARRGAEKRAPEDIFRPRLRQAVECRPRAEFYEADARASGGKHEENRCTGGERACSFVNWVNWVNWVNVTSPFLTHVQTSRNATRMCSSPRCRGWLEGSLPLDFAVVNQ